MLVNDGVKFLVAKGFFIDTYHKFKSRKEEIMWKWKDLVTDSYLNISCL